MLTTKRLAEGMVLVVFILIDMVLGTWGAGLVLVAVSLFYLIQYGCARYAEHKHDDTSTYPGLIQQNTIQEIRGDAISQEFTNVRVRIKDNVYKKKGIER